MDYFATTPVVPPEPFRGVSAPRLRELSLEGIPIPALPKLLLFATHLVDLILYNIPYPGYVSPEVVVTCPSMLTNLERLRLEFQWHPFYPNPEILRPCPHPLTRSVLPSLITFGFGGVSEYLEGFVARIDAPPRLNPLTINFVNHIVFDTLQLVHFINHMLRLMVPDEVRVTFYGPSVFVTLLSPAPGSEEPYVKILCVKFNWRV